MRRSHCTCNVCEVQDANRIRVSLDGSCAWPLSRISGTQYIRIHYNYALSLLYMLCISLACLACRNIALETIELVKVYKSGRYL